MPILAKCEKILNQWKRRKLTPLGKISVIKTFILSSFNHIFTSLPAPCTILLRKLNNLLYSFLWDDKPDKIKRKFVTNSYLHGGLNMVDIDTFIKCQKLTWVKRLIQTPNAPWAKLLSSVIPIEKLYLLGPFWAKTAASTITNGFWKEVLLAWSFLLFGVTPTESELLIYPIWHNPQISCKPLFYPHWYKAGIVTPLDLLKQDSTIKTLEEIKQQFNIKSNFLEYLTIQRSLKRYLANCNVNITNPQRPFLPTNLKILLCQKKGSQQFYKLLNKEVQNDVLRNKWCTILNIYITENDWEQIYKICFKTLPINDIIWFQYRIIHRILGTKDYLNKLKINTTSSCIFCNVFDETLLHLFTSCPFVLDFFNKLKLWLQQSFSLYINFNPESIILGYLNKDIDFFPRNCIIPTAKNSFLIVQEMAIQ